MAGANTYTGITTISAGTLQLGSSTSLPTNTLAGGTNLVINTGGKLDLNSFSIALGAAPTGTGGTITNASAPNSTSTLTFNGGGTLAQTLTDSNATTANTGKLALALTAGTLTINAANSYTGGTSVTGGTAVLGNASGFGTGTVAVGTAGTVTIGLNATIGNVFTGTGAVTINTSGGNTQFNSATAFNGFTGTLNVNSNGGNKTVLNANGETIGSGATVNVANGATLFIANSSTFSGVTFNLSGTGNGEGLGALRLEGPTIAASSAVNLLTDSAIGGNNANSTINAVIAGTGGLSKVGGNTLILGGANTYSGTTSINGGTLNLSNALALQNSTFATGGTLVFDQSVTGNAFTFGGLSGSANIALLNNASTPAAISLTVGGNNAFTAYSGVLSGTGSNFTKTGTGTFALNTAATLTGNFTVGNGVLSVVGDTNTITAGPVILGTAGAANTTALTVSNNGRTFASAISTQGTGGTNTLQAQGGGQGFTFTGGFTLGNNLTLSTFGGSDSITVQTGAIGGTGNLVTNVTTISAGGGGGVAGTTGASGGTISLNSAVNNVGTITNSGNGSSNVTISGAIGSAVLGVIQNSTTSSLVLSGSNVYTGPTTVRAGTLSVTNAGTAGGANGGTLGGTAVTVNTTGTLLLGASNALGTSTSVALAGGTFKNGGAFNEGSAVTTAGGSVTGGSNVAGMGALTLSATSTLDFGSSHGTLVFASLSDPSNFTLNIANYSNTHYNFATNTSGINASDDRLIFSSDPAAYLSDINFGANKAATEISLGGGFYEVGMTAVPEPGTVFAALLLVGFVGYRERRRLKGLIALVAIAA